MIKLIIAQLEGISKGILMWENVAKNGKLEMTVEIKTIEKQNALCEARTHDLQIMRLTR